MNQEITHINTGSSTMGHKVELLQALNAAAASLQQSVHSEQEVFQAFSEQVVRLGLRGGLSLLDKTGKRLIVRVLAQPSKLLSRLERLVGITAEGFEFDFVQVDIFCQVVETKEAIFVADNGASIMQLVPQVARPLVKHIIKAVGSTPVILAPLITAAQVYGVINVDGVGLTPDDVPTITVFANQISIALNNTAYLPLWGK